MTEKASFAKTQHYVPQFLLKNFALPAKEQVFVFDKREERSFRANVRKVAAENGFYDIKLPEGTVSAEAALSSLEGGAARVISALLKSQNIRVMTDDDKVVMALFIGAQMLRVTHQIELAYQITEMIRKRWGDVPGMPAPEDSLEEARQSMVNNLSIAVDLLPNLLDKTWLLLKAHHKASFYISDNPVTLHNIHQNPWRGSLGLNVKGIEVYLPLSADTALGLFCRSHEEGWRRTMAQQDLIKSLGLKIPSGFEAHEARFALLVEGISTGKAIELSEKVTIFQNELQVWHSSRFVFSKAGDFELVKDTLKRQPKTKQGPRLAGAE
jgi:hypothetical protein